jgi:hypothetical protein
LRAEIDICVSPPRPCGAEREKGRHLQRHVRVAAAVVGLALVLAGQQPLLGADEKASVEAIRKELLQLPYYGVFDFLAFSYDKGTVTLMGYAYPLTLKHDAAHAAKRASGVDQVIDEIEELPVSPFDDELRNQSTNRGIDEHPHPNPTTADRFRGGGLARGSRSVRLGAD